MIPFELTDLKIIQVESDEGQLTFFLLMESDKSAIFNIDTFTNEFEAYLDGDEDDESYDAEFDQFLEEIGVIELFSQDDIDEMLEDDLLNPDDIHQSLYEYLIAEEEG